MAAQNNEENIKFDAEVGKILQLMIHSLYANKEIFLRELISNASDACDKLRYLSLTNQNLIKGSTELKISISIDEEKRILKISDNGIGMNKNDLIENIGTIARSGTQKFAEKLTGDANKDLQLIGQFGVGFYSGFMVADEIEVITQKAGEDQAWLWKSKGDGEYSLKSLDNPETTQGTVISLHLKKDEDEFLDKFRLRHIAKTYSDHISFPIELVSSDGQGEIINDNAAIWQRAKSEITDEQHNNFYKQVAHLPDSPWLVIHNKNEGLVEYTNLLYIPSSKPFDLFNPERKSKLKLYVKKVFIGDSNINLVPAYLRFLYGVVDSDDLPLNISRETLQHNHSLEKIRKAISKKVISELKQKLEKDSAEYEIFWNNFGAVLKEGLCEAMLIDEREKLLEVCLFKSALHGNLITLASYIENMKEGQDQIFYLSADNFDKAKNSPQLEGFLKNNIDVLVFVDTVDDFWVNVVNNYKEKELKSVTRSGIELDKIINTKTDTDNNHEEKTDPVSDQALIEFVKKTLGNNIMDAKISTKLVDSPVCLAVADGAMDIRMERYLKEQKQIGTSFAKILEINSKHPIIVKIISKLADETKTDEYNLAQELVLALYDQACIIEGESLRDIASFSKRMNELLVRI